MVSCRSLVKESEQENCTRRAVMMKKNFILRSKSQTLNSNRVRNQLRLRRYFYNFCRFFPGNDIPFRYGEFPLELASTPICDIDPYYSDKRTFMVLSKGGSIYRFSASSALLCLSPFNSIRRIAIMVLTHRLFSMLVIVTILVNCGFMILPDTE